MPCHLIASRRHHLTLSKQQSPLHPHISQAYTHTYIHTCSAFSIERYESRKPVYFPTTAILTRGNEGSSTVEAMPSHCWIRVWSSWRGKGEAAAEEEWGEGQA